MESSFGIFILLYFVGLFIRSRNKKAGAIFDLVWSVGLLIFAIAVISSGGQLLLFNIELPNIVIVLIILAVMVSEIITLVKIFKEPSAEEQLAALENAPLPEGVEPIENDGKAKISLTRERKFAGSGAMIPVLLNGKIMGNIGNGKTLELHTRQKHNKISLLYGTKPPVIEFDAEDGKEYTFHISAGVANATMTMD